MTISIDFTNHERVLSMMVSGIGGALYAASKEAEAPTSELLREMLLSNYDEVMGDTTDNKYRQRTGYMRSVIAQSGVTIWINMYNPRILYWLPSNANKYENSKTGFYEIFSALAYGSVRNTGASKRTKRAVKKAALKNEGLARQKKKKRRGFMFQGYETEITKVNEKSISLTAHRAVSDEKIATETSVVVIKPKNFWPLSSSQERRLSAFAMEEVSKAIQRRR